MKYSCPCCGYYTFPLPAEQAVAYICSRMLLGKRCIIESDDEPSDGKPWFNVK